MTKESHYLDTTLADPFTPVGLGFDADTFIVSNPTRFTIALRVGAQSRPRGAADSTYAVAPGSLLCLPTHGRQFSFLATTPTLPAPPEGMPTRVEITLTKNEPAPAFGSIVLAGIFASASVLKIQPDRAAGTFPNTDVIPVPSGTPTLVLRFGSNINSLAANIPLTVTGTQSGRVYFELNAPSGGSYLGAVTGWLGAATFAAAVIRFDPELDTSVTILSRSTQSVDNGYTLMGYAERLPVAVHHSDGRQIVDAYPPGQSYLDVYPTFGFPVQLAVNTPTLPPRGQVVVKAAGNVAGVGAHDFTFNATGWRGVLLVIDFIVDGTGTVNPQVLLLPSVGALQLVLPAAGALGPGSVAVGIDIGPGASGAGAVAVRNIVQRLAANITDDMGLRLTHSDASVWSYAIYAYPVY